MEDASPAPGGLLRWSGPAATLGRVGDRDRPSPAPGGIEAVGEELLEDALGEWALVFVVAQGVVPVPGDPEQHADNEQDDLGEARSSPAGC